MMNQLVETTLDAIVTTQQKIDDETAATCMKLIEGCTVKPQFIILPPGFTVEPFVPELPEYII